MERHNIEQGDGTTEHPMERGDFLRSFGLLKGRPAKSVEADDDEVTSEETIQETIAMPENLNISLGTIIRWMNIYGYRYDTARKHFYNDTRCVFFLRGEVCDK